MTFEETWNIARIMQLKKLMQWFYNFLFVFVYSIKKKIPLCERKKILNLKGIYFKAIENSKQLKKVVIRETETYQNILTNTKLSILLIQNFCNVNDVGLHHATCFLVLKIITIKKVENKNTTLPGLEPGIPWFVVRCLIHWATGP